MKHIFNAFISILILLSSVYAQNSIVLCEKYDETGTPTGIYSTWDIAPTGGYVYLLYRQDRSLGSGIWYLYIDKDWDNNGIYSAYETIELTEDVSKNWTVYDYKFTEAGKYKAFIMFSGEKMASTDFSINMKDATPLDDTEEAIDTYYFENSDILFCESVNDIGEPIGTNYQFSVTETGTREVMVYLSNDLPFKTSLMYVTILDANTSVQVDDFSIDVEQDWDWVKFKQTFPKPGTYIVDIYTEDDIFINTATVSIVR